MNALQKLLYGGLTAMVVAYGIMRYYGEKPLLIGLYGLVVAALLSLAVVRMLMASLLQMIFVIIRWCCYGIGDFADWLHDKLEDYKVSLSENKDGKARSSVPDWDKFERQDDSNASLDELMESSEH